MCHPATRKRVLKWITDWINIPQPLLRILWLNGPAGAGKSAIAQTIAEHCSDEQLAASFFFLRASSDRSTATRLFTTLAWQLAWNIPEILPYIELAIEAEPLLPTKSINIQFDRLIVKAFKGLLHDVPDFRPKKSLVIIDGVDECTPDQDQLLFLRLIGDALCKSQIPLRFLICSRPEAHIQEVFGSGVMVKVTNPVPLDYRFKPNRDIRRYLKHEFGRIYTERKLSVPEWPPDEAIDQLVSKSSGQFIYASTVVKFIEDMDGDPIDQLDILLKTRPVDFSSPFAELDQLYIQILSLQPDIRLLKDLFTLIIALRQPSISFVCRRLRVSKRELERKLRRLRSLVQISWWDIDTYHLSLHDFFLDKKRSGKYFIHPIRVTFVRLPRIMGPLLTGSLYTICLGPCLVLALRDAQRACNSYPNLRLLPFPCKFILSRNMSLIVNLIHPLENLIVPRAGQLFRVLPIPLHVIKCIRIIILSCSTYCFITSLLPCLPYPSGYLDITSVWFLVYLIFFLGS